jgi:hypothetical protein
VAKNRLYIHKHLHIHRNRRKASSETSAFRIGIQGKNWTRDGEESARKGCIINLTPEATKTAPRTKPLRTRCATLRIENEEAKAHGTP